MNKKNLMIAFGIVGLIYGIGFLIVPATLADIYELDTSNLQANLIARYFGTGLITLAVINFFASRLPEASEGQRPVIYGNLVSCVTGIIATVIWMASELNVTLMWLNIVIYGGFGLAFAYLEFVKKTETA